MVKLAFDLDGTLYDSLLPIFKIDAEIRRELGYSGVSMNEYKKVFQYKDWHKFYSDLEIKEKDTERVIEMFFERLTRAEPPMLIPGAREALYKAKKAVGSENIHIITNEAIERVELRFKRDGLAYFLKNIDNPPNDKSGEIHRLAQQNSGGAFAYIGDLVSDGEACLEARENGADNVLFYGILHEQAMNHPEQILDFVAQNKDFAQTLNSLNDIDIIWDQR